MITIKDKEGKEYAFPKNMISMCPKGSAQGVYTYLFFPENKVALREGCFQLLCRKDRTLRIEESRQ